MSTRPSLAFAMGLREYARTPLLLGLLLFLPAYMIGVFGWVTPDTALTVEAGVTSVRTTFPELYAVAMVPMVAALVGGIAGLFAMQTATAADRRLVITGYSPAEVLLARFGLLLVAAMAVAPVALAVSSLFHVPERLGWLAVSTVLVVVLYGVVGFLVGIVANRLVGVYVVLFASMLDVFLYQNPTVSDPSWIATYLPAHYPMALAIDAAFTPSVELFPLWASMGYLAIVGVSAAVVYRISLGLG